VIEARPSRQVLSTAGRQIINDADFMARLDKRPGDVGPDEPASTGYQDTHESPLRVGPPSTIFGHTSVSTRAPGPASRLSRREAWAQPSLLEGSITVRSLGHPGPKRWSIWSACLVAAGPARSVPRPKLGPARWSGIEAGTDEGPKKRVWSMGT
jgi:hypothetical protein